MLAFRRPMMVILSVMLKHIKEHTRSHHWIMTVTGHSGAWVKHSEALKSS